MNDPANGPLRPSRWFWVGVVVVVTACSAALVPLREGAVAPPAAQGDGDAPSAIATASAADAPDDGLPFSDPRAARSPEERLVAAYAALARGHGRSALAQAEALVRDQPHFSLAQMLKSDLLAARAGLPSAFGAELRLDMSAIEVDDPARLALRDEARQRLAALLDRPPQDRLPSGLLQLAPWIRHAVVVDASRSRLYLFANGPEGPRLVSDTYISVGKAGVAKRIEGDQRTPLGVYWITSALDATRLDDRFGAAALRINYPNAWDRMAGRTGSGLYLHGVPRRTLSRPPLETDGCVAMANDDIAQLLATLDVDATPVVIAEQLRWSTPAEIGQAAAEFRPAFEAWDDARQSADDRDLARWYLAYATRPPADAIDTRPTLDASFVAWHGESVPIMVVTTRRAAPAAGADPDVYRQYWVQRRGRWRIAFDGQVPVRGRALAALRPGWSGQP